MKKISLFIMSIFAVGVTLAQTVDDFSFIPPTTDNNMSIVFPNNVLGDFLGGQLQAYVGVQPVSAASEIVFNEPTDGSDPAIVGGVGVMGADATCGGCPMASPSDALSFAILMNGEVIVITDVDPAITYVANSFEMVSGSLYFTVDSGCADASACNFIDLPVVFTTSNCTYAEENLDCDGNCLNDADGDLICDEYEIAGCEDPLSCSYDDSATDDDGSCTYPDAGYDCDGVCLNDADLDGVCDEFEVLGCQDDAYDNYNSLATDAGVCIGLLGCTDDAYFEYYSSSSSTVLGASLGAEVDNGTCATLIVEGCHKSTALNYDVLANFGNIASIADGGLCEYPDGVSAWGVAPGTDVAPSYITSNNMSVLFPTENLGVWSGSDMSAGDIIFATYETATLVNEMVGYSEISEIQSAGAVVWTGAQVGMPIFGADNNQDNGFQEAEELVWIVISGGVYYNATLTYATADYNGSYEDGEFVIVSSVAIGSPFYSGCMNSSSMNFNPLATTDDGSCDDAYSVGCMDESSVNFAGADANPTHDNANNFGDAFVENVGVDLLTGSITPSGVAANIHNQDYCQTQVEGCTDAMAINYDALATQNDKTICDWSLNAMTEYNVDSDGNILETEYSFGAVDPINENDGIVGSDFENANILFQDGALDMNAHVIDNLADVMEWIDADEIADAQELADTNAVTTARYNANDLMWLTTYTDTLAAVEAWFAADEAADAQELADTVSDMQARYDANDLMWLTTYTDTLADVAAWFAADEAADAAHLDSTEVSDDALLALTISDMQAAYDANEAMWLAYTAATLVSSDSLLAVTNDTLDYHRAALVIDLHTQWNTIAYYLHHESPVVAQFENQFGSETAIAENINIVKNNEGLFYWPEFNFDGIVMLEPGQGYQVRVKDSSNGKSDFIFDHSINADAYRTLIPTVPAWAIEMDVQNHPNDIRTLVRVVNMLGQEVNPTNQFNGEVLLYMYNDGTVEKKMVE